MIEKRDLLFEIGCEELPASFVDAALLALPELASKELADLRLGSERITAMGTPRRLALVVNGLDTAQTDLEEEVMGPPVKAAFKDGAPTKAAEAFAAKIGCAVGDLTRVDTPKGEYLKGTRRERGRPARDLLPAALAKLATSIPFRKSMRWGSGTLTFGRPLRWLVVLFGSDVLDVGLGDLRSGRDSRGHRFMHPGTLSIESVDRYTAVLRAAHVLVDPDERARVMRERLALAATRAGGELIEDEFLVRENLSLVEDPQVVIGSFDPEFLELPDEVILAVARGHQRYFGLRSAGGAGAALSDGSGPKGPEPPTLLARYLAVVNTASNPAKIAQGNDRVMRARLADARFFYRADLERALITRRQDLAGIVFHHRLGTVLDKSNRIERLAQAVGEMVGADAAAVEAAVEGARLCKCDLVSLMVGELPELQGEMGRAYALEQGVREAVADCIRDHYRPKGAKDATPQVLSSALVALADRLDTLVGCFAVGLAPTGTADPYGLRRACIGVLRIVLDLGLPLALGSAFAAAHRGYDAALLDLDFAALNDKLAAFTHERLRGLLADGLPGDAVDAALAIAADRPLDARARAEAISRLDADVRARLGEVFKRATNIAKDAPQGQPDRGSEPAEVALYDAFFGMRAELEARIETADYAAAFRLLADLAPALGRYFDEVLVMADDVEVKRRRLRLMRSISETCSRLAKLELLGDGAPTPKREG